jgi:hypothetical protein
MKTDHRHQVPETFLHQYLLTGEYIALREHISQQLAENLVIYTLRSSVPDIRRWGGALSTLLVVYPTDAACMPLKTVGTSWVSHKLIFLQIRQDVI